MSRRRDWYAVQFSRDIVVVSVIYREARGWRFLVVHRASADILLKTFVSNWIKCVFVTSGGQELIEWVESTP